MQSDTNPTGDQPLGDAATGTAPNDAAAQTQADPTAAPVKPLAAPKAKAEAAPKAKADTAPKPQPPAPAPEPEKPKFAPPYAELKLSAMLCILTESDTLTTDVFSGQPKSEKSEARIYHTKAYWQAVEKDPATGIPRYARMKLLGLAVFNEEKQQYDGYLPFKA